MNEYANCDMCDEQFKKMRESHKTCSPKCRLDKKNLERTQNWINKKERVGAPGGGWKLSYSHLSQRQSWARKFQACRG